MVLHYFEISKYGARSYLQKQMLDLVLQGDLRIMGSYNSHSREQKKEVQMTCDETVDVELLTAMHMEGIQKIPDEYNTIQITRDHLVRGDEGRRLQAEHVRKVESQWRKSTEPAGFKVTRTLRDALTKQGEETLLPHRMRERIRAAQQGRREPRMEQEIRGGTEQEEGDAIQIGLKRPHIKTPERDPQGPQLSTTTEATAANMETEPTTASTENERNERRRDEFPPTPHCLKYYIGT